VTAFALRTRPILCLVTDQRIWSDTVRGSGTGRAGEDEQILAIVRAAAGAGIDLVQIRDRFRTARELVALAGACVETVRGTDTMIVVNDRADVALAAGAHGVHLPATSLPAVRLRQAMPPGFLIGRSIHAIDDVLAGAGDGADYLIAGTMFPSRSKQPDAPTLGARGLERIVAASAVPVLAIGGITTETAPIVAAAGAAGVAGIDVFGSAWRQRQDLAGVCERMRTLFRDGAVRDATG
jgi:thiamine-phosphate pyrophosphorylase